jgi:hypothetical protein
MKRRKFLPAGLLFLAILGHFAGAALFNEELPRRAEASTGAAWQASPGSDFVATPIPSAGIVAVPRPPLQPSLPSAEVGALRQDREGGLLSRDRSGRELHAVLVSAQVLEKYLPFRESLTSP